MRPMSGCKDNAVYREKRERGERVGALPPKFPPVTPPEYVITPVE